MVMLLADRFSSSSAPASAAWLDGGTGIQMSSQISTWNVTSTEPWLRNSRSVPNGVACPAKSISWTITLAPDTKCRFS